MTMTAWGHCGLPEPSPCLVRGVPAGGLVWDELLVTAVTEWPLGIVASSTGIVASCWLLPQGPPASVPVGVVSLAPPGTPHPQLHPAG